MKTAHCHRRLNTTRSADTKSRRMLSATIAAGALLVMGAAAFAGKCDAKEFIAVKKSDTENTGTSAVSETSRKGSERMTTVYDFKEKTIDGNEIDFSTYKGNVLLIVNTASECGFTHQYKGLEELHKKFEGKGLKILGFPCNQFGNQEPGDSKTIASFCQKNFGVTFQLFEKVDVKGKAANPLFKYLTDAAPGVLGSKAIKWNFTKFLVDRQGNVVKRFGPNVEPEKLIPELESALK